MITVVLAAGLGERFSAQGYPSPKPATMVDGRAMIVRMLEASAARPPIRLLLNRMHRGWRIDEMVAAAGIDGVSPIEMQRTTRGPAETLLMGLDGVPDTESVLVLDCDVLHPRIVTDTASAMSCGAIFCFEDLGQSPMFSYVYCDKDGRVTRIAEKEKISERACSGAYFFAHAGRLRDACRHVIRMGETSRGEYYISNVVARLIHLGERFVAPMYGPYRCLGTPEQLREICSSEQRPCSGLRMCFDLDGTLVSYPKVRGDYSTVEPVESNIEFLRQAKERGAYVIIYTARRMRTHGGDVAKVVADIGDVTRETLSRFEIPHDELVFGKPYAHFYIDDLAVPAWGDLEKWTGVYPRSIGARKHNTVDIRKDHVVKISGNPGEGYFYTHMPDSIKDLFPGIISIDGDTIKMDKIDGEPASHVYAAGNMTSADVLSIVDALHHIHSSSSVPEGFDSGRNYARKLRSRQQSYDFGKLGLSAAVERIMLSLDAYEKSGRIRSCVVHGDPVFSNVFLGKTVKFIDPRGKQGDDLSIYGDMLYDFAKVHQSLSGYDSIILKTSFPNNRDELVGAFEAHVCRILGSDAVQDVRAIGASLLISLLPLHDDSNVPAFVDLLNERYGDHV